MSNTIDRSWSCVGIDRQTGKRSKIKITATSKTEAITAATDSGLVGVVAKEIKLSQRLLALQFGRAGSNKEVAIVMRALATTADTLPMVDALRNSTQGLPKKSRLRDIIDEIAGDIYAGQTVGAAFKKQVKHFGSAITGVFEAGSETGQMGPLLNELAEELERAGRIRGKYISAMIYPSVVMVLVIGSVLLQGKMVLPRYQIMLEEAGGSEPLPMKAVLLFTDIVTNRYLYVLGVFALLIGFWKWLRSRDQSALPIARTMLRLPLFGQIIRNSAVATFCIQMGIMQNAGVPMSGCLEMVKPAIKNAWMKRRLDDVHASVVSGLDPAKAFMSLEKDMGGVVPSLVKQSYGLALPGTPWLQFGGSIGEEVERKAEQMSVLIEPIMLLLAIGIVLMIGLSSALAMLQIYQGI